MAEPKKEMQKQEAKTPEQGERTSDRRMYSPNVDILEKANDIIVVADMPGVDENSVDITLEKNVLTIYGRVEAEIPQNLRLARAEYGIGDYQRVFTLTDEINRDKIHATVRNGVLKLILPKAETAKTRKIQVNAEGESGAIDVTR
jgi:HSP20 family molecular chaperone IbpA